jgi:serine/threonine protein kinase/tetratricopeptide (TPR) repeat protein
MIAQVISHYRILEKLGEGGMGIVYKAHDTKLDRTVALKFLPVAVSSDSDEMARFINEAKAVSSLSHPQIATIHYLEEAGDQKFLVLEYIEGGTLRQEMRRHQLSVSQVLEYAIQIAEGLAHAHKKGIVHRDIKTDNVMISGEGKLKITDFGLAKFRGISRVTKIGSTVGTAAYMSPEQARGEDVDQRTDIWSFGVLLYEMLANQLPFSGAYEQALIYLILHEDPKPIKDKRNDLPGSLEHVVMKALSKNLEERYQTIDEMLVDLTQVREEIQNVSAGKRASRRIASPSGNIQRLFSPKASVFVGAAIVIAVLALMVVRLGSNKQAIMTGSQVVKIAVIPFENLGPADHEYFADGLTDEVSTRIGGLSGLSVIAYSSAKQYKKTTKSVQEIGAELGVGYLLEGTIHWEEVDSSNHKIVRLRVNPRLIKIEDGTQMWSQSLEGTMAGVFKIQSEISQQVASALDVVLLQPERESVNMKPTENPEAYDYYLRGNDILSGGFTPENLRNGISMYEKAIDADPAFALAHARLGRYHTVMYFFKLDHSNERLQKAREAIDKAFQLRPNLAEAHIASGYYFKNTTLDLDRAIEQFKLAKNAQPNNADLLHGLGLCLFYQGNYKEGLSNLTRAIELDPRSVQYLNTIGQVSTFLRKYDEANKYIDRLLELFPNYQDAYWCKAMLLLQSEGKTEHARTVVDAMSKKFNSVWPVYLHARLDILDREYDSAMSRIASAGRKDTIGYYTTAAYIAYLRTQTSLQHAMAESARVWLDTRGREVLVSHVYHRYLSEVYALLGRRQEAILERNATIANVYSFENMFLISGLAEINVMTGEPDTAVALIRNALSLPTNLSVPLLRLDPVWDPLRGNPRFQELMAEDR